MKINSLAYKALCIFIAITWFGKVVIKSNKAISIVICFLDYVIVVGLNDISSESACTIAIS